MIIENFRQLDSKSDGERVFTLIKTVGKFVFFPDGKVVAKAKNGQGQRTKLNDTQRGFA